MFRTDDTIVAIATPPGRGGIGVVRVSGPDAEPIGRALTNRREPFEPRRATFVRLENPRADQRDPAATCSVRDHLLITFFPSPHSYTGEDVLEISAHGSPVVLQAIVQQAMSAGARLAEPGEFTLRAFLHGKLDLIQAEAVADLIASVTPLQARAAFDQLEGTLTHAIASIEGNLFALMAKLEASLDFPEEGYHFIEPGSVLHEIACVIAEVDDLVAGARRGRLIREGAQVAIVGAPNVGKSSLFNALLNANRAIVTAVPGTTRDLITERAEVAGLSLALVDSAGIRETVDVVEEEGVKRARALVEVADLILVVLDRSRALVADDIEILQKTAARPRIVVFNKSDVPARADRMEAAVEVSVLTGVGLDALVSLIAEALGARADERDRPCVTNVRHADLLVRAREGLRRAHAAVTAHGTIPEEFLLADLQDAAACLQEITGSRSTDELLRHIFDRFCIGK